MKIFLIIIFFQAHTGWVPSQMQETTPMENMAQCMEVLKAMRMTGPNSHNKSLGHVVAYCGPVPAEGKE